MIRIFERNKIERKIYGKNVFICMWIIAWFERKIFNLKYKNFAHCLEILHLIARMAICAFQQIVVKSTRNYPINYLSSYPRTNHLRAILKQNSRSHRISIPSRLVSITNLHPRPKGSEFLETFWKLCKISIREFVWIS